MKKLIIFGTGDMASLAHFYFTNDSKYEVVAFCVNLNYIKNNNTLNNLPIIPFENIDETYPPDKYLFFAPMAPTRMNRDRESIYLKIKEKGYTLISYISSKAIILTETIGENCFILENNVIQPFVEISNNVILWSGNGVWGVFNWDRKFSSDIRI